MAAERGKLLIDLYVGVGFAWASVVVANWQAIRTIRAMVNSRKLAAWLGEALVVCLFAPAVISLVTLATALRDLNGGSLPPSASVSVLTAAVFLAGAYWLFRDR